MHSKNAQTNYVENNIIKGLVSPIVFEKEQGEFCCERKHVCGHCDGPRVILMSQKGDYVRSNRHHVTANHLKQHNRHVACHAFLCCEKSKPKILFLSKMVS